MNERDEGARSQSPRDRDATLAAAILRVGGSLDLDTVLRAVVDGARALTGARYGVITTVDDAGRPQDFVTSGFTPDEHRAMETWPDGLRVFGHLRELAAPLRLPDLDAWVRSLGCSPFPVPGGTFQATPMRHREKTAGGFFLGGKEAGFTDADEEVLVLFAQQAAAALANARAHREEQRARADLAALVETCPVGVAVFDAGSGVVLSLNREARRITAPLAPDGSAERLREAVVCRRGDGREVTLGDLGNAETVRAEEVEIFVPGGASGRTLIDATPVRSAEGAVERVVATLQDLAPFEALERSRAEFPEHGEPRAANAAGRHQGLGRDGARGRAGTRPGRAAPVPARHRGAGRPHGRADRRPAGRRPSSARACCRGTRRRRTWPA